MGESEQPVGVSFLLCTFNGVALIAETLVALAHQCPPCHVQWEVVVVDNASTDGTVDLAQRVWKELGEPAPLHLLYEPRPGKQYAQELGIGQLKYRYACIVDDDNRLALDYLQVGYELLESNPSIGIVGGKSIGTFEGQQPKWFPEFQQCYAVGPQIDYVSGEFKPLADGNVGRNVLWGAGMFVRTAVWQKLRAAGFRSLFSGRQGTGNLTAGEDDELCYAALLLGYEVWYSSRLVLRHYMAANRLSEDYRDRLFFASARSTPRLNAYRNALWGRQEASVGHNLAKDIAFQAVSLLKSVLSLDFVRAAFGSPSIVRMKHRHTLAVLTDEVLHFSQIKTYYEQVLQLKHRFSLSSLHSTAAALCSKS